MLNKSSEAAIAAMSRLAEVYHRKPNTLTAAQIAEARHLKRPFVAKLLTVLSAAGLVDGRPGRVGGYRLARPPRKITLAQITDCFERRDRALACPFGPDYCGNGEKCPLHDEISALQESVRTYLRGTNLGVFVPAKRKTR